VNITWLVICGQDGTSFCTPSTWWSSQAKASCTGVVADPHVEVLGHGQRVEGVEDLVDREKGLVPRVGEEGRDLTGVGLVGVGLWRALLAPGTDTVEVPAGGEVLEDLSCGRVELPLHRAAGEADQGVDGGQVPGVVAQQGGGQVAPGAECDDRADPVLRVVGRDHLADPRAVGLAEEGDLARVERLLRVVDHG
jgi:hypothetical protein